MVGLKIESGSWPKISRINVVNLHVDFWRKSVNLFWRGVTFVIEGNWLVFMLLRSWGKWEKFSWTSEGFRVSVKVNWGGFGVSFTLGHSEWWLSVPMLSSSGNSKSSLWVNKWLLESNGRCIAKE